MIDDKESDEIDQMVENDESRLTDDMEILKLGKLSSQKNIENIGKEYDERNRIDMVGDKESDEIEQIGGIKAGE